MSKSRNMHDSFLHFLADNLTGIPVRELKYDINDDTANVVMTGALNVSFLTSTFDAVKETSVSLEVANDDALVAKDWEESISNLLHATAMTEVLDYTNPVAPANVPQARISWPRKIIFRTVVSDTYYHSTATTTVTYS